MRVILPGGMRVDWTPDEVAEAMRILTQSMLDAATGREQSGLTVDAGLRVDPDARLIYVDGVSIDVGPKQVAVAKMVADHRHQSPAVLDVYRFVWMNDEKPRDDAERRNVVDSVIRALNRKLRNKGAAKEFSVDEGCVILT